MTYNDKIRELTKTVPVILWTSDFHETLQEHRLKHHRISLPIRNSEIGLKTWCSEL